MTAAATFKYVAYGLNILSEYRLPELLTADFEAPDVSIRLRKLAFVEKKAGGYRSVTFEHENGYGCFIRGVGAVWVKNQQDIYIDPYTDAEARGFRFLISGVALGLLLDLRGMFTLHASAVAKDGKAIAFVGPKGAGKSTTVAYFCSRGYSLLTDDLLALRTADDYVTAYPGFPGLKLYPDSVRGALSVDPASVPKIDPKGTKRDVTMRGSFAQNPAILQCIVSLDYADQTKGVDSPGKVRLYGYDACIEILKNSFVSRLFIRPSREEIYLHASIKLANVVSVYKLYREKNVMKLYRLYKDLI